MDPVEHDKIIGAYYYAWYKPNMDWLRRSPSEPVLGEYTTKNEAVVNQHIKWALESGINTFIIRWGGQDHWDDTYIREYVLEAELSEEIDFMIQPSVHSLSADSGYSIGDPIDFDKRATRENVKDVFKYLNQEFFQRSNHARLVDKPVLTLFGGAMFEGDFGSAFAEAKDAIDETPFIIADLSQFLTSAYVDDARFKGIDAATTYSLYRSQKAAELDFDGYQRYLNKQGLEWRLGAEQRGIGWVPTVMPGADDTEVRPEQDHSPIEPSPDRFKQFIEGQRNYIDPDLDAIFVTSFNEWYEDTAVEPRKEGGTAYLDLIEDEIAKADIEPIEIDNYEKLKIAFNMTVDSKSGNRELALMINRLDIRNTEGSIATSYDIGVSAKEPYIVEGGYPPEKNPDGWGTWRWFGGETGEAVMYFEPEVSERETVALRGTPMADNEIEADIYFNGQHTDHIAFGERGPPKWYNVSLQPL